MLRKKIALLTINTESVQVINAIKGIYAQSLEYNCDVAVVTPMVHTSHFFKDYLEGELRVFDLLNFDMFDGVIITPVPLQEEQNTGVIDALLEKFKAECHVPVVSVDAPFGDYDVVYSNEESGLAAITSHIIKKHGCKDIAVLTGPIEMDVSHDRVEVIKKCMADEGLVLDDSKIVYGDFWYTSGVKLAEDIASGAFAKPEAVICTSDHMAIGLANGLSDLGIRVPEDVAVVAYGGVIESAVSNIPITTYEYDSSYTGALAVNKLVELMEPGRELVPAVIAGDENICYGASCGCSENATKIRKSLREVMGVTLYSQGSKDANSGVSLIEMTDSYISETFTSAEDIYDCLKKIYESLYLLKPYTCFYLCLNNDWLENNRNDLGYSDKMNMVIYSDMAKKLHGYPNHVFWGKNELKTFDRKIMIPVFDNKVAKFIPGLEDIKEDEDIFDEPQAYYFTPLHYSNVTIGYAVLQKSLRETVRTSNVYRTYIRYINNALEMSRAKNIIRNISEHDQLTGLYNRRGLERAYSDWCDDIYEEKRKCSEDKPINVFAMVIDMNNLKLINDTEGHDAGDKGIIAIANAAQITASGREIVVRGGGDEFFILGIGQYSEEDGKAIIKKFKENLEKINNSFTPAANYTAAAGYAIMPLEQCDDYHVVLDEADVQMYVDKRATKKGRH